MPCQECVSPVEEFHQASTSVCFSSYNMRLARLNSNDTSLVAKIRELGGHYLIYGFGSIAQSAVGILFIPLFTAHFSTAEYGVFSLLTVTGTIVGGFFYLGVTSALPRSYFDYEDEFDRKRCFSTTFILLSFGAIAQVGLGFFAKDALSQLLFGNEEYAFLVWMALVSSAMGFVGNLFLVYLRLLRLSMPVMVTGVVVLVLNLAVVYYLVAVMEMGVGGAVIGQLGVQAALVAGFIIYLAPRALTFNILKDEIPLQLKFGIGAVFASIAGLSIQWSGQFFVNEYAGVSEVGIFSLGARLASVANILLIVPMMQIWSPMMMEYRTHKDCDEMFTEVVFYYWLIGLFIVLGAAVFVTDALSLIVSNDDYMESAALTPLLMLGVVCYGMVNFTAAGLHFERRLFKLSKVYYVAAVINLIMSFLLIPTYGLWGAVWVNLFISVVAPFSIYLSAREYFKIEFGLFRLFKVAVIAGVLVFTDHIVIIDNLLPRLLVKSFFIFLFPCFIYLFVLDSKAKQFIRGAIDKVTLIGRKA
jgi:O-antigen/teichoic acid export membrane protein